MPACTSLGCLGEVRSRRGGWKEERSILCLGNTEGRRIEVGEECTLSWFYQERLKVYVKYKEAGLVHDRHNKQGVSPGCRSIDSHVGDHGLRFSIPRDHHSNLCVCLQPGFNATRPKPPSSHPSSSGRFPRAQAQTLQRCPRTHFHRGEALHPTGGGGDPTQSWRESQR